MLFKKADDAAYYELNPHYYKRFVSAKQFPEVEILPQTIPLEKPKNTERVFLIGDQSLCSAFPDANKEQILADFEHEGMNIDIIQLAVPLTNSFAVKRLVKCIGRYDADACVIVTGANEFYGLPRKSTWMQDINNYSGLGWYVTMKNHRFIQVLERFVYMKRDDQEHFPPLTPDEWVIEYDSEAYKESQQYFDRNLKKITKTAKFPLFIISLPSNIKYEPYRSIFADKELQDDELARECAVMTANADRFIIDRWIKDLESWEPESAILYYCKAIIAETEGNQKKALEYYNRAVELDGFRVRFNRDMYWSLVKYETEDNVVHVDLFKAANEASENGLHIDQYFSDGITLSAKGLELFKSKIRSALQDYFNQ